MVFVAAKPNPKENRFRSVGATIGRPQHCPRLHPLPRKNSAPLGATIGRPFFHAKRQQTEKRESLGGTRATDGRPYKIHTPPTKQSAEPSHNQNSVKQKQTKEAAVSYHHVGATIGRPHGNRRARSPKNLRTRRGDHRSPVTLLSSLPAFPKPSVPVGATIGRPFFHARGQRTVNREFLRGTIPIKPRRFL